MRRPPLKTLRRYCVDNCCNGQNNEVRLCPSTECALWPYRFGGIPDPRPELTVLQSIRARCMDCSSGCAKDVRECPETECELYPFRMGKNPNRAGCGNPNPLLTWNGKQTERISQADSEASDEVDEELVVAEASA